MVLSSVHGGKNGIGRSEDSSCLLTPLLVFPGGREGVVDSLGNTLKYWGMEGVYSQGYQCPVSKMKLCFPKCQELPQEERLHSDCIDL